MKIIFAALLVVMGTAYGQSPKMACVRNGHVVGLSEYTEAHCTKIGGRWVEDTGAQPVPNNTVDCDPHVVNGKEVKHCAIEPDAPKQVKPQPAPPETNIFSCDDKYSCITYMSIAPPQPVWKHELTKDGAYVQTFADPSGKWRCVITSSSRNQFTMTCMDATLDEPTPAAGKKEDANGK